MTSHLIYLVCCHKYSQKTFCNTSCLVTTIPSTTRHKNQFITMKCERDWITWFNTYDTNKSEQISVLQKREMPRFYSEDWAAHRAVNLGQPLQHKRNKRSWKCISRSRKYQQVHVHSAACTCICTPFSVSPSLPLSLALPHTHMEKRWPCWLTEHEET